MFSKQIYLKLKIKKIKIMTLDPKKKKMHFIRVTRLVAI